MNSHLYVAWRDLAPVFGSFGNAESSRREA
jgi:hypothetical protein